MLRVHDLTKRYGGLVAIEHVSFDVRPGEVFGLLGPNGSGKSTTLNDSLGFALLMVTGFGVLGALEIAGRRRARTWAMPPDSEMDDADPEALTFLNLGPDAGHNPQAGLKPCATTNH